jgi:hypothetical protein
MIADAAGCGNFPDTSSTYDRCHLEFIMTSF